MFQATYVGSFNALRGYIITLLPGHKSDSFIRTVSIFIIDRQGLLTHSEKWGQSFSEIEFQMSYPHNFTREDFTVLCKYLMCNFQMRSHEGFEPIVRCTVYARSNRMQRQLRLRFRPKPTTYIIMKLHIVQHSSIPCPVWSIHTCEASYLDPFN